MATAFTRLDRAGQLNRAREQQQLFCERGLARIWVGNDRECPAARYLARNLLTRCRAIALQIIGFGRISGVGHHRQSKKASESSGFGRSSPTGRFWVKLTRVILPLLGWESD